MGVQGLWELLAPVGRRVSVEALSGRKLAIDASIWIIQFMKAMRDDKGDMIRNAHLLGFFRRICKLLYLRAKPVFVFDGGTPALKRRTVIARRRQRERAQSKIRKTAEKLLLNHLRTRKLDEIAQNIGIGQSVDKPGQMNIGLVENISMEQAGKKQRKLARPKGKNEEVDSKIENPIVQQPPLVPQEPPMPHDNGKSTDPSATQEDGEHVTSDGGMANTSDGTDDDNEEYFMLPPTQGRVDPAVLASLPPSMQLNLLVQMREQLVTDNRKRFQKVAKNPASFSQMQIQAYLKTVAFRRDINQVQKAAAGKGIGGIPSARIASEVDREYIFSTSFQPEKKAAEVDTVETHQASRTGQDNLHTSESRQSQERLPKGGDMGMAERVSLPESSPQKVLDDNGSPEDKDIEWEDGDDSVVLATSQPVKGAVITIEINQDELLAEGIEVHKLYPDAGSESEGIEWEDDVSAVDCMNGDDLKDAPATMAECAIGNSFLTSTGVDSPEVVDRTLMEIEAAELEEAIRQSLQDQKGCKVPKLVIRDDLSFESKEHEVLPPQSISVESSLSEEAYLARERERKGKALVDDSQAMCLENRIEEGNETPTVERTDVMQVFDGGTDSWKPSMSEVNISTPSSGLMSHVFHSTIQAHANDSTTSLNPLVSEIDIGVPSERHLCEGASLTINRTARGVRCALSKLEQVGEEEKNLEEQQQAATSLQAIVDTPEIVDANVDAVSKLEQVVEEQKNLEEKQQVASSLQESFETPEIVNANPDAAMEDEKVVPSSPIGNSIGDEDEQLQQALLKEAEEIDLNVEREAFAKQERDLLAEREELSRQQAELQAVMEAEQAAMHANLEEERDLLLQEEMELRATQRKNERNAELVSGEMFSECQELLQMFGLPYIIAPMEAEAQCAYMDSLGLVDGVVTEDSDVFLFGGRNVFKNIFDDRKYVETYYMKDVESEMGLHQEKLIHMALLLGSDYTEGISGIGIVNAIEVVNAFEGEAGLQKFKEWLDAPDLTLLEKFHQDGQKKQTKKKRAERENEAEEIKGAEEPDDTAKGGSSTSKYNHRQQDFMDKHRAVSKNWNVPESFPNPMVINAYIEAQVDKSSESFTWGRPDLEALRRLCLERFGWNKSKSDELLLPVLKEYDRHETQLRLEAFYSFNQRFAKIRSKRIQKAVTHVTGRLSSELVDFPKEDYSKESSPTMGEGVDLNSKNEADIKVAPLTKASAKRAAGPKGRKKKASQVEEAIQEVAGRGWGRGIKSSRGRAKGTNRSDSRLSGEASSSDGSSSEEKSDLDRNKVLSAGPRRSNRLPQRTVYKFSGSEDDSDSSWLGRSKAGGSPGRIGSFPPLDIRNVEESAVFSSSRFVEAETNQDGDETGCTSADGGQYGLQGQGDEDYLFMGGGFCAADTDDGSMQELTCDPSDSHTAKEGFARNNDLKIIPEESLCSDAPFLGSITSQTEFSNGGTAGQSTTVEPTLPAVPLLRWKKRRIS